MRVCFFNTKAWDRHSFDKANVGYGHQLDYLSPHLEAGTAALAEGYPAVCAFVNDTLDAPTLETLAAGGVKLIVLRCAGYNNVDLSKADALGLTVARVPAYSPPAVAEHTVALMLALNRKLHRAFNRVREGNFALDGLLGFDMQHKTVGVVGTGQIGETLVRILAGFGCRILTVDPIVNPACEAAGAEYVDLDTLFKESHIISLHCPLTPESHHLIDADAIARMRDSVMIINTSRGAVVDARAAIDGLKSGKIGYLGLDVYEEEGDLFFENLSDRVIQDDVFARLMTFHNVLITGHQAFFTTEALDNIARTTLENLSEFENSGHCSTAVGGNSER